MTDIATKPVETLRDHATALEAALAVCLGDSKPKSVHKLHTEAQLLLLDQMHVLLPFRKEAAKVQKHLKKLRHVAGRVRDLDVQRKLLENEETQTYAKRAARAMAKLRLVRGYQAIAK